MSWSDPINLGPIINSPHWEGHYTENHARNLQMLVSNHGKNHQGGDDIYLIQQNITPKNPPLSLYITDQDDKPIDSARALFFMKKGAIFDATNVINGQLNISIPIDENLWVHIQKKGYHSPLIPVNTILQESKKEQIVCIEDHKIIHFPCQIVTNPIWTNHMTTTWLTKLQENPSTHLSINGTSWKWCQSTKEFFYSKTDSTSSTNYRRYIHDGLRIKHSGRSSNT